MRASLANEINRDRACVRRSFRRRLASDFAIDWSPLTALSFGLVAGD
jgi:hypothetical protein